MRKTYEKVFCDCCGQEMIEGSENFFTKDCNEIDSMYLPYRVELRYPNEDIEYTTKTIELKDICNICYHRICTFTEKLIPNLNNVIKLDNNK